MADYIDRDELINKITKQPIHYIGGVKGYLEIKNIINGMPSVDAVEVVRCKDCKYRETTNIGNFCQKICAIQGDASVYLEIYDNDYCKWGEKE